MHLCTTCTHSCGNGFFQMCEVKDWDITVYEPDDHINWCEDYEEKVEIADAHGR